MDIKLELLSNEISGLVTQRLDAISIDAGKIADAAAITILSDIQKIVQNDDLSDFDAMEEIVCTLKKYGVSAGERHDFG